jgi:hypothetical protein
VGSSRVFIITWVWRTACHGRDREKPWMALCFFGSVSANWQSATSKRRPVADGTGRIRIQYRPARDRVLADPAAHLDDAGSLASPADLELPA